jgi:hypothetical protein
VLVDKTRDRAVSREKEIQLSLLSILKKIYFFLHENKTEEDPFFRAFPKDCCFYSTYFAAITLERMGHWPVYWVLGNRESTGSHVWGECEDIVFDLTAGQYSDSLSEYLIYPKDFNRNVFHSSFNVGEKGEFDDRFRHDEIYFKLFSKADSLMSMIHA